ncbi:MAG: caspase family protein [Deltaproteobacteria bacterium]|nr:caspase family protein [Deltaproteobacteria bacterium]
MKKSGILFLALAIQFSFTGWVHAAKHALCIGISDYTSSHLRSLPGAENDLELVKHLLITRFGVPAKNIVELKNPQATHSGIEAAFKALARKVKSGDTVYIHYSGHGSLIQDPSGYKWSGFNPTWVSFGARSDVVSGPEIDRYDILDGEINEWLVAIYSRTQDIVFVSDSCHSATVSRGDAPAVRAAPPASKNQPHPLTTKSFLHADFKSGIWIGAAKDTESANEFPCESDNKRYGLFTWYWVKSLQDADPKDTWNDVFKRAYGQVKMENGTQTPQIKGQATAGNRQIFNGDFKPPSKTVSIVKIEDEGKMVVINAGSLAGVTMSSVYRVTRPGAGQAETARFRIQRAHPTDSVGTVIAGRVQPGDVAMEDTHVYPFEKMKVFINADFQGVQDKELVKELAQMVNGLPAYEVTTEQKSCSLVLYVLRPKMGKAGYEYKQASDTLPKSFAELPPEVWVLTPAERLIHSSLTIKFTNKSQGLKDLAAELKKYARIKEIKSLAPKNDGQSSPIEYGLSNLVKMDTPESNSLKIDQGWLKKTEDIPRDKLLGHKFKVGQYVGFRLKNVSTKPYHFYILNISPSGKIWTVFPSSRAPQDALIAPGKEIDFKEAVIEFDNPGDETIKIIAADNSIDTTLLEEKGFVENTARRGEINPLERMLNAAMGGIRGDNEMKYGSWDSVQFELTVEPVQ